MRRGSNNKILLVKTAWCVVLNGHNIFLREKNKSHEHRWAHQFQGDAGFYKTLATHSEASFYSLQSKWRKWRYKCDTKHLLPIRLCDPNGKWRPRGFQTRCWCFEAVAVWLGLEKDWFGFKHRIWWLTECGATPVFGFTESDGSQVLVLHRIWPSVQIRAVVTFFFFKSKTQNILFMASSKPWKVSLTDLN